MSDALAIAASGLKAEEFYIDKIANDLANLNTDNYKASKLTFEDALYQSVNHSDSPSDAQNITQIGLGTSIYSSAKEFSQGPLKPGSDWHDIAINGPGFFQVTNADGNLAYTRNSTLMVDSEGFLATREGFRLADNIQIPEDYSDISIDKSGEVKAIFGEDQEPQVLGNIKLAKFLNPETLNSLGSGLYSTTELTGEPIIETPGSGGTGELLQKQIEGSNVNMVNSLMQLTMAQRIYQLNAKAVQIADELEKMTNELRN